MKKDKYFLFRERPNVFCPCYWNLIYQTWPKTKKLYGFVIDIGWAHFEHDRQKMFLLKSNWDEGAGHIFKKLVRKNYFNKINNKVEKEKKKIEIFIADFETIKLPGLNFKELIRLLNKIKKLCLDYDGANVLAWLLGSDKLQEYLFNRLNLSQKDFHLIISPQEKTAVSQLEYEILSYSKKIKEGKSNINEVAQGLSKNYGWIPFGYNGPEYWDKNYFIKELNEINRKLISELSEKIEILENRNKKELEKRNEILSGLGEKELDLIHIANILALWTDERKKYTFQLYYLYSKILWVMEKRFGVPYKNLKYLFTEELADLEKNKENLKKISIERINNDFMIEARKGIVKIVLEKKKEKILKELANQFKGSDVKGMVASRGPSSSYRGIVKVILSPKESSKVEKGDFLVATMTSPDYIMAMRQAAGFITDEGGVTCHAAIVAREMNKPCIIGTKIATKVLKDGDLVEVDANKGIVKIIKKA